MIPLEGLYKTLSLFETVSWGFPSNRSWGQAHIKGVSENQLLFQMADYNLWEIRNIRKEIKSGNGGSGEEKKQAGSWNVSCTEFWVIKGSMQILVLSFPTLAKSPNLLYVVSFAPQQGGKNNNN